MRRAYWRRQVGCLGVLLCLLVIAFGERSVRAEGLQGGSEKGRVLAEVDGLKITVEELDRSLALLLHRVEQQLFQVRSQKLEELIADRLLANEAAKRKISMEELIEKEVTSKAEKVTDEEVNTVYQQNKSRLPGEEKEVRERVRSYLQEQKAEGAKERFVASLKTQAHISMYLEEPEPPVVAAILIEGSPSKGPGGAPVILVEFSDYQ